MSAAVCGKRSFFEEFPSPPLSKRARCSSSSPVPIDVVLSPSPSLLLAHLTSLFPDMDKKILARALEECNDDLDMAIKKLNELQLGVANNDIGAGANQSDDTLKATNQTEVTFDQQQQNASSEQVPSENMPKDGAKWVELFVNEMMSATHLEDARVRASRSLEFFEKSLFSRAGLEAAQNFQQENTMLKEQLQVHSHENTILKRAVAIQHERQKDFDAKVHELQHFRQLIPQYQEQLRKLEVNNYTLSMHLNQAKQTNTIAGRFHPDIF